MSESTDDDPDTGLSPNVVDVALENLDEEALLERAAQVYLLWWGWADFELTIVSPTFPTISPPRIILPDIAQGIQPEFVYPIHDHGSSLSTSKGLDMFAAGLSMCKLYYTIEKMIYLLIERLKSGGIATETEVQIAFGGHELSQRKAFESVINLSYNVVVTNFDPGSWGERYLETVRRLSERGYGYPPAAPRDSFRNTHGASSSGVKRKR